MQVIAQNHDLPVEVRASAGSRRIGRLFPAGALVVAIVFSGTPMSDVADSQPLSPKNRVIQLFNSVKLPKSTSVASNCTHLTRAIGDGSGVTVLVTLDQIRT